MRNRTALGWITVSVIRPLTESLLPSMLVTRRIYCAPLSALKRTSSLSLMSVVLAALMLVAPGLTFWLIVVSRGALKAVWSRAVFS